MVTAVEAASRLGLRKLRITGGEPLVKSNLLSLCRKVSSKVDELCLTTNATLLAPQAVRLREAGVSRINISLDTLNAARYRYITRTGELNDALHGIEAALSAGFERVKINTVLIGGFNDDEIRDFAALTRRYPADVRFIELMPMLQSADFTADSYLPVSVVLKTLPDLCPQPQDGGVAKLYRLPGALGNIGLITPISEHFCTVCNRIRLTSDGKLKPCLHSPQEYPLKGMNLAEMTVQFQKAIAAKPAEHPPLSAASASPSGRRMNQIGG